MKRRINKRCLIPPKINTWRCLNWKTKEHRNTALRIIDTMKRRINKCRLILKNTNMAMIELKTKAHRNKELAVMYHENEGCISVVNTEK